MIRIGFLEVIALSPSKLLKLIGFLINIGASLYLIHGIFFRGPGRASLLDYLTGETRRKLWEENWSYVAQPTWNDLEKSYRDPFITSLLVILGSSLQMAGDLLDP
jgi:hypothetical protein